MQSINLPVVEADIFESKLLEQINDSGSLQNMDTIQQLISLISSGVKLREHKALFISILQSTTKLSYILAFTKLGGVQIIIQWLQRALSDRDISLFHHIILWFTTLKMEVWQTIHSDSIKQIQSAILSSMKLFPQALSNATQRMKTSKPTTDSPIYYFEEQEVNKIKNDVSFLESRFTIRMQTQKKITSTQVAKSSTTVGSTGKTTTIKSTNLSSGGDHGRASSTTTNTTTSGSHSAKRPHPASSSSNTSSAKKSKSEPVKPITYLPLSATTAPTSSSTPSATPPLSGTKPLPLQQIQTNKEFRNTSSSITTNTHNLSRPTTSSTPITSNAGGRGASTTTVSGSSSSTTVTAAAANNNKDGVSSTGGTVSLVSSVMSQLMGGGGSSQKMTTTTTLGNRNTAKASTTKSTLPTTTIATTTTSSKEDVSSSTPIISAVSDVSTTDVVEPQVEVEDLDDFRSFDSTYHLYHNKSNSTGKKQKRISWPDLPAEDDPTCPTSGSTTKVIMSLVQIREFETDEQYYQNNNEKKSAIRLASESFETKKDNDDNADNDIPVTTTTVAAAGTVIHKESVNYKYLRDKEHAGERATLRSHHKATKDLSTSTSTSSSTRNSSSSSKKRRNVRNMGDYSDYYENNAANTYNSYNDNYQYPDRYKMTSSSSTSSNNTFHTSIPTRASIATDYDTYMKSYTRNNNSSSSNSSSTGIDSADSPDNHPPPSSTSNITSFSSTVRSHTNIEGEEEQEQQEEGAVAEEEEVEDEDGDSGLWFLEYLPSYIQNLTSDQLAKLLELLQLPENTHVIADPEGSDFVALVESIAPGVTRSRSETTAMES